MLLHMLGAAGILVTDAPSHLRPIEDTIFPLVKGPPQSLHMHLADRRGLRHQSTIEIYRPHGLTVHDGAVGILFL